MIGKLVILVRQVELVRLGTGRDCLYTSSSISVARQQNEEGPNKEYLLEILVFLRTEEAARGLAVHYLCKSGQGRRVMR